MRQLERELTTVQATAIVVGVVIGTGIFLKTAVMAQNAGSEAGVLAAWIVAGVMSFAGALVYAELSATFPKTGGEYVFLREAYGDLPAFLYGWTRFLIISPGSIAAYAVGSATFLESAIPLGSFKTPFALLLLLIFTAVNCFSVRVGGRVQTLLTFLKVALTVGLTAALFLFGQRAGGVVETAPAMPTLTGFSAAILAALWAFDGWSNLPLAAGEVKNPAKALPRALAGGMFLVLILYVALNLAYFHVLPLAEIQKSSSVAARAAQEVMGHAGVSGLSILFVLSALGAMNASILTGARAPFAMAQDGLFFRRLGEVHKKTHVPVVAVLVQGAISAVLAVAGTFDQLTDYVVFAAWIFYALVTYSLFIFRRQKKKLPRTFMTPGYPFLPIIFLLFSAVLLLNTLRTSPKESLIGLFLIALGIPFYIYFKRSGLKTARR